ncbi:type II secretion system protein N [Pseudomonas sp. NPDC089428]|uniref:type II secretion system protein N n=1 Tax=Pseudomonas sp. NPDC089428 TaxID=3364467 RepID=UPI0037FA474E
MPALAAPAAVEARHPLPASTLALAFGFEVADAKASTRSDITLKGSFVSSLGEARALISSNAKDAVYRVGDSLPGGGVVRRIEARAITLWFDGREETLAMAAPAGTLLRPASTQTSLRPSSPPSRFLLRNSQ